MPTKNKPAEKALSAQPQRAPQPEAHRSGEREPGLHPAIALQRAKDLPASALNPSDILALQRTIGNRAVQRLLADQTAAPPPAASSAPPIQRQADEAESAQRKPLAASITPLVQRLQAPGEDECVQTKRIERGEGFAAGRELESPLQASRGSGSPLPDPLRLRMERGFGTSFAQVRVHTGDESDRLNQSLQSRAFTTGQDLYFKRGEYNPASHAGQKLIAHELTHVIQQNGGRHANEVGASAGQNPTIQRVWWNPRSWCGTSTREVERREEEKPVALAPRATVTEQPDAKAEAPQPAPTASDELQEFRDSLPHELTWAKGKEARIYADLEALRYILQYKKVFASTTGLENKRLRKLSFTQLQEMKAQSDLEGVEKQKAEDRKKEQKDIAEAAKLKKIGDNQKALADKAQALQPELKAKAEALGLTWDTKWDGQINARRNLLNDAWYETATPQTMDKKAGEIIKYVSKEITAEKADALVQKKGERGLAFRNRAVMSEKAQTGTMTLTEFGEVAEAAIKRQGKLSMRDWKNELKFTDYSEGTVKLISLKEFETHLTADDNSFKEPQYAAGVAETPTTIAEKLLKVRKEFQIHVTVSTGHKDSSGAWKNPHLYWFYENAPLLVDKDGNSRFDPPLTADELKTHMAKELKTVKDSTATKIQSTIDSQDTTEE